MSVQSEAALDGTTPIVSMPSGEFGIATQGCEFAPGPALNLQSRR